MSKSQRGGRGRESGASAVLSFRYTRKMSPARRTNSASRRSKRARVRGKYGASTEGPATMFESWDRPRWKQVSSRKNCKRHGHTKQGLGQNTHLPKQSLSQHRHLPKQDLSHNRHLPKQGPSQNTHLPKQGLCQNKHLPKQGLSQNKHLPKQCVGQHRHLPKQGLTQNRHLPKQGLSQNRHLPKQGLVCV